MSKKRLFIAIYPPEKLRQELYQAAYDKLPYIDGLRVLEPEMLHLTVVFLGYMDISFIDKIEKSLEDVVKNIKPFELNFTKIKPGPDIRKPRLFWLEGEPSQELIELKNTTEKELGYLRLRPETRELRPHITVARLSRNYADWTRNDAEKYTIPFLAEFSVDHISLVGSKLERGGAEYTILKNYKFQNPNDK